MFGEFLLSKWHKEIIVCENQSMNLIPTAFLNDITVLRAIWFPKVGASSHAERLQEFYAPQAAAYDQFRKRFLWGRLPLMQACAARIKSDWHTSKSRVVWVDLGGGTGQNVETMSLLLSEGDTPLLLKDVFDAIYVVDLCSALCEEARKCVARHPEWNEIVQVVEADAADFVPPGEAHADWVTFSYSLSMMPPFFPIIDRVKSYLRQDGRVGVCDFTVSNKYDTIQSMGWARRFFWQSMFDLDGVHIGPDRRAYLKHMFPSTEWERTGSGSIPYVPILKAPWYAWIGRLVGQPTTRYENHRMTIKHPTFIYNISWEDPAEDAKWMNWNANDVVLTLAGGGCNAFELLTHDVKRVVAVDCNPAQTALLELKKAAFQQLPFEDVWDMFGAGSLVAGTYNKRTVAEVDALYDTKLAPFMSSQAQSFWDQHFKNVFGKKNCTLYDHGGMGVFCWFIRKYLLPWIGKNLSNAVLQCTTLEEQRCLWKDSIIDTLFAKKHIVANAARCLCESLVSNRFLMWYAAGVPTKQLERMPKDETVMQYMYLALKGVFEHTHIATNNYFYRNILTGSFDLGCCPAYLKREHFNTIRARLDRIHIVNNTFLGELEQATFTKVIMMDHVDWTSDAYTDRLTELLQSQVQIGGRVAWRSASENPDYAGKLTRKDYIPIRQINRKQTQIMDRVNMYAHFSVIERVAQK